MEHLLFWSKYTNIHNIFKYVIFQKALLWNKGLSLDFGASFVRRNDGVWDKDVRHINSYSLCIPPKMRGGGAYFFWCKCCVQDTSRTSGQSATKSAWIYNIGA